jgi:hypothetical protein
MRADIAAFGYDFDYVIDAAQDVARAFDAVCTPDFFLFDRERRLVCHGQFDSSRPGNDVPIDGADLRRAADAVLSGSALPALQAPSIGCNIKWRR